MRYYAHSANAKGEWHLLADHLRAVAGLAARFAADFGAEEEGRAAGVLHDLGKGCEAFQQRLEGKHVAVDHSTPGALWAKDNAKDMRWVPCAMAISGHHGGMANPTELKRRLEAVTDMSGIGQECLFQHCPAPSLPPLPPRLVGGNREVRDAQRSLEFFTRMLYSCLVDADFLDTEFFYDPDKRAVAMKGFSTIPELQDRLNRYMEDLTSGAPDTLVNKVRGQVLRACRLCAEHEPGVFSLSVPTGGGKTLSSLAFALKHAETHGLRRVIVVIPYTSIIEQNADIYRNVLGADNLIEHHASIEIEKETVRNRLASENWDAPVIVTTSVQFFESLFASKPSRCRKLHNIARSVVILDEVQTLPPGLLMAIMEALRELAANYRTTVLLSTATQPALAQREGFPWGLSNVREIMDDPNRLAEQLRRVEVKWPDPHVSVVEWDELANDVSMLDKALVVVNRRKDARELAEALPEEGRFHLSALMCPQHRTETLEKIKAALEGRGPCRVASTQVVEAGVDIDFPVVYRAMAGLDSITQAAGRCNREGGLASGEVRVFRAPRTPPPGVLLKAAQVTEEVLASCGGSLDLTAPETHERFFRKLYFASDLDAKGIQPLREGLQFDETARRFQMIEDGGSVPVVAPYGESAQLVETLRKNGPTRESLRRLQPFVVNVYPNQLRDLETCGAVEVVADTVRVLAQPFEYLYSDAFGLQDCNEVQGDGTEFVMGS